jgi:hypothetical protein
MWAFKFSLSYGQPSIVYVMCSCVSVYVCTHTDTDTGTHKQNIYCNNMNTRNINLRRYMIKQITTVYMTALTGWYV